MPEQKHHLCGSRGDQPRCDGPTSKSIVPDNRKPTTPEELRVAIEEGLRREKIQGLRLAGRLLRRYGSHERLPRLLDVADKYEGWAWLWALGELWTGLDNIGIHGGELFDQVVTRTAIVGSGIFQLMSEEEQAAYDALPDELVIYRGCGPRNLFGFSWSLDRDIAAKFPFTRRYHTDQPTLLTARIPKSRAAAIKLSRQEQEIIVFDYVDEPSFNWTTELLDPTPTLV